MTHDNEALVEWTGNATDGTSDYGAYGREYRITVAGKPDLLGSADPRFRGDAALHNPEDFFLASISACHMLTYLALCARRGLRVVAYRDLASGALAFAPGGGGCFERVTLRPDVTILEEADRDIAARLHDDAHNRCVIAASCRVPIDCHPTIAVSAVSEHQA